MEAIHALKATFELADQKLRCDKALIEAHHSQQLC